MTPEQINYRSAVCAVGLAAGMLRQYDLPALLVAIERADAIGPIVDPTLWRDMSEAMYMDRDAMRAALPLWQYAKKHLEPLADSVEKLCDDIAARGAK